MKKLINVLIVCEIAHVIMDSVRAFILYDSWRIQKEQEHE